MKKQAELGPVVAVAWYRESDWPRVKALFPDADQLHDTYAEWLASAEDAIEQIKRLVFLLCRPLSISMTLSDGA